jgi:stage II sporulation protein AA (anti-sigma F factor antagonist)
VSTVDITAWDDAGVHIVQVAGALDTIACEEFRTACVRPGAELLVVDLRGATFLDSRALGELMGLQRDISARGARLAILRPEGSADRIFKLTGMDGHLPLYDGRVPLLAQFNYG